MEKVDLMRQFTRSYLLDIDNARVPKEMNIAFDGGAFNGYFGLGVAIFLKELEHAELTTVKKVSGVSAGSILALWYLIKQPKTDLNEQFVLLSKHFNTHNNLRIFRSMAHHTVMSNIDSDDLTFLNDRLYISYYDIKKHKRRTICRFKDRKHLINTIIKSCHIPFVVSDRIAYYNRYIDGMRPYIFDECDKTMFVKVSTFSKLSRMFSTCGESNIIHRLVVGIADANDFFTTGGSDMCTFVDEWSRLSKFAFYNRELLFIFLFYLLNCMVGPTDTPFKFSLAFKESIKHISWCSLNVQHYS
tara:strand:- start:966 stop:1868 length:903 start_codon:yes stop_codon:yes gene_type:complete